MLLEEARRKKGKGKIARLGFIFLPSEEFLFPNVNKKKKKKTEGGTCQSPCGSSNCFHNVYH